MAKYSKEAKRKLAAFKDVFESPNGEVVLKELEQHVGDISYVKGDPYHTAFNEGKRELLARIRIMVSEANEAERSSHGRASTESDTTEQSAANEPGTD